MIRLFLLITVLSALPLCSAELTAEQSQEIEFDRHWLAYLLAEHGCAPQVSPDVVTPVRQEDCKGVPQLKAYEKKQARDLAKKVFGLTEPTTKKRRFFGLR